MLLASSGSHAYSQSLYKHPLYNAATDFAPIALLATTTVLITRKDLPSKDLPIFISYAQPINRMQYGSDAGGRLSKSHDLLSPKFKNLVFNVTHVPYRGGALPDLLAGRIDYLCSLVSPNIAPHIATNAVKAIAVLSKNRTPVLPNIPSASEHEGLADFEGNTWFAFFMPKGTPAAIIQRFHSATSECNDIFGQEKLGKLGAELVAPERRSPEYLAAICCE